MDDNQQNNSRKTECQLCANVISKLEICIKNDMKKHFLLIATFNKHTNTQHHTQYNNKCTHIMPTHKTINTTPQKQSKPTLTQCTSA